MANSEFIGPHFRVALGTFDCSSALQWKKNVSTKILTTYCQTDQSQGSWRAQDFCVDTEISIFCFQLQLEVSLNEKLGRCKES